MSIVAHKILVIDDEPHIRRLLRTTLDRAGYRVTEAGTAREAMSVLPIERPDVILLDLGLPDRDGLELVQLIRKQSAAPLIVVSAREETESKVTALDLGADDYVAKPFDTEELLARIRTSLRRRIATNAESQKIVAGDVEIDLLARLVKKAGVEVRLTPKEYGFLAELATHPGRVFTHTRLLASVWGNLADQHVEYLRVVVRNLRQKLEDEPARPRLIVNELGVGYRLRSTEP